ncbi:MAG: hypothetical protein QW350_04555 [Candidatus Aenigmatarchaeota archaeon]
MTPIDSRNYLTQNDSLNNFIDDEFFKRPIQKRNKNVNSTIEQIYELQNLINKAPTDDNEFKMRTYLTQKGLKLPRPIVEFLNNSTNAYQQKIYTKDGQKLILKQRIQCVGYVIILSNLFPEIPYIEAHSFVWPGEIMPREILPEENTTNIGPYIIQRPFSNDKLPEMELYIGSRYFGAFFY